MNAANAIEENSLQGLAAFAELVTRIGSSTGTNDKLDALVDYFSTADDRDKLWVIAIFSGRRPRRAISTTFLAAWCVELTGIPQWLFQECYGTVGDLAETIALLLPEPETLQQQNIGALHEYIDQLKALEKAGEEEKKAVVLSAWKIMNRAERFVFNKLITGSFRIGVSQKLMVNALAKSVSLDPNVIAHRLSGNWDPASVSFAELLNDEIEDANHSRPYPFFLAYAIQEEELQSLGMPDEWQAEWKWDGIRGQIIKRAGELYVWSRGEELMTEKFPEYNNLKELLPDGVAIDGEIIPAIDGKPLPFALLQTRIGRKNITRKQLQEVPIAFFVYDLLEWNGEDWRSTPLSERRAQLEKLVAQVNQPNLILSPVVPFESWEALADLRKTSREMGAEGFMLKRKSSTYQVGRKRGDWGKWKIDPLTIDAVLVYAQKGAGRRSNLYTDYTFAVRDGDKLVPFTKAYSGLTDKEFAQVDAFIKRNAIEKFGPVRTVKPELVFEIGFEGIAASNRHKSGVALRFPRMLRWRHDKSVEEINTLEDLREMLAKFTAGKG
jgi:DNA ligase-1